MFDAIVHGMGRLLANFYEFLPNYGVAIILLTVLVRLAMIPLAVKQAHIMEANRGNQEKMRKLAPEVKKIKEKYKDDRTRQYEEQKKLYDQHGINMLGGLSGCLPLLLQMPIFMAMYQVLSGCNKLFGSGRKCVPGFHIPSVSDLHEAIVSGRARFLGMNLNLTPTAVFRSDGLPDALPYYILIALMGLTMWYQMKQMSKSQTVDPAMAQAQKLMQVMPLMLVVFSVNFPVGLTVYWTATNVWTIGQQYVLLKHVAKVAGRPAPATTKEGTGLFARLLGAGSGSGKGGASPAKPEAERRKPGSAQKPGTGRAGGGRPREARGTGSRASGAASARRKDGSDRVRREGTGQTKRRESAASGDGARVNGQPSGKDASPNGQPGADRAGGGEAGRGDTGERKTGGTGKSPAPPGRAAGGPRGSGSSRPARKGGQQRGSGKSKSSARRKSRGGRK